MKNTFKKVGNFVKDTAVDTISWNLGAVHFITETIGDGALALEAEVKHRAYGVMREDVKTERFRKTVQAQGDVLNLLEMTTSAIHDAVMNIPSPKEIISKVKHPTQVEDDKVNPTTGTMVVAGHYKTTLQAV